MAFWAKKKAGNEADKKDANSTNLLKKKDEKKGGPPKRIDHLRIARKLHIKLRSLGTGNEYHFLTKDLSATGMLVLCSDHKRYPFQVQSTLLETVIQLQAVGESETHELRCLCKIARLVDGKVTGFGVRIVQISPEQRQALEQFISKHGSPDNLVPYSASGSPHEEHTPASTEDQVAISTEPGQEGIGQDTPFGNLPTSA